MVVKIRCNYGCFKGIVDWVFDLRYGPMRSEVLPKHRVVRFAYLATLRIDNTSDVFKTSESKHREHTINFRSLLKVYLSTASIRSKGSAESLILQNICRLNLAQISI